VPSEVAYPFAGTPNARVSLAIVDIVSGERQPLDLAAVVGEDDTEYLARVSWGVEPLLVGVQPRDQRALHVVAVDAGGPRSLRRITAEPWFELGDGGLAWLGGLLTIEDVADDSGTLRRALCRDGVALTPPGLEVRSLLDVARDEVAPDGQDAATGTVILSVSSDDPTSLHIVTVRIAAADGGDAEVSDPLDAAPGLHHAVVAFAADGSREVVVRRVADLEDDGPRLTVEAAGRVHALPSVAERPDVDVRVRMLELGPRRLRAALLLPAQHGDGPLPVVLDPYAGPHAQRVLHARAAYHGSQWLADHGFAVLIVDGRGTPGRGPAFEHSVRGDLAGPALEDQLDALDAAAEVEPRLDLSRVGIRGWSYGGTLSALAALRRPDRIRCAIVGAPVTDWRLYDTHYTERYLGHPDRDPDAYLRSAVVLPDGRPVGPDAGAEDARPAEMLIVHGLVDDNVLAAHSLRLTEALHAAGHPFTFLPLTDATHMASDPQVAARLLEVQVRFLQRGLALG
jgi:dipeptidyl-peptidase-4